jgi:hypothetical protein
VSALAVRVRLRIRAKNGEETRTSALVNSGFETEKPQLLIPLRLAREIGLWPPPPDSRIEEFETAGGPTRNYVIRDALEVSVETEDRDVGPVTCDAVISNLEFEVLINDKLGGELKIVLLDLGRGKWKFSDDPWDRMRDSSPPQFWE